MRSAVVLFVSMFIGSYCMGQEADVEAAKDLWTRESLLNNLCGGGESLAAGGIEVGLCATQVYQQNVRGGLSTHDHDGRYTGSYDVEIAGDLEKFLGLKGGLLFLHLEGGWPDAAGIDESSVGSFFGVNADAIGDRAMDVKQLFYEGPLFGEKARMMVGKIDLTGIFDACAYADNECGQFLNGAFVDNPTIPFPEYGLGTVLSVDLTDCWYVMGGIADGQADGRETGFRTTFHDEDYFISLLETGIEGDLQSDNGAMPGAFRLGGWYDGCEKERFDDGRINRDDTGLYVTCDQMVYRETGQEADDQQGIGIFGRYGLADSQVNELGNFWSVGSQYKGLLPGRDEDVLGLAVAQGIFSDDAGMNEDSESVLELYYSAQVAGWLSVSPSLQYVSDPGGDGNADDAVVLAVRVHMVL